jgi:hypothetical protein
VTSDPRRLSAGWDEGQRLMSALALPEQPGLRRAATTGSGSEPERAVVQAEEADRNYPERVSVRRTPQARWRRTNNFARAA